MIFRPQIAPERLAAAATAADGAALDELWLWEDCFLAGGMSSAAIALANSERLKVGIGILPVPMRNVALTAMEIATIDRAYPGRIRIGLGHGVQDWMAQIGEKVASPMTLLREYVTVLSSLLRGDRVTFDGRYVKIADVALDWPPRTDIELLIGAEAAPDARAQWRDRFGHGDHRRNVARRSPASFGARRHRGAPKRGIRTTFDRRVPDLRHRAGRRTAGA